MKIGVIGAGTSVLLWPSGWCRLAEFIRDECCRLPSATRRSGRSVGQMLFTGVVFRFSFTRRLALAP